MEINPHNPFSDIKISDSKVRLPSVGAQINTEVLRSYSDTNKFGDALSKYWGICDYTTALADSSSSNSTEDPKARLTKFAQKIGKNEILALRLLKHDDKNAVTAEVLRLFNYYDKISNDTLRQHELKALFERLSTVLGEELCIETYLSNTKMTTWLLQNYLTKAIDALIKNSQSPLSNSDWLFNQVQINAEQFKRLYANTQYRSFSGAILSIPAGEFSSCVFNQTIFTRIDPNVKFFNSTFTRSIFKHDFETGPTFVKCDFTCLNISELPRVAPISSEVTITDRTTLPFQRCKFVFVHTLSKEKLDARTIPAQSEMCTFTHCQLVAPSDNSVRLCLVVNGLDQVDLVGDFTNVALQCFSPPSNLGIENAQIPKLTPTTTLYPWQNQASPNTWFKAGETVTTIDPNGVSTYSQKYINCSISHSLNTINANDTAKEKTLADAGFIQYRLIAVNA